MAATLLRRPLRSLFILFLFATGFAARAQVDNVYVYGTVKDQFTAKKLDGITVTVFKNGAKLAEAVTSASGKYEFNLDYGSEYKLLYSKPGMVSKNITIDTRNVPEEERAGGHGMNIEVNLFNELPGIDFSVLQQPIGKAKIDATTNEMSWDLQYTAQIRSEVDRLMKEYEDKRKREAGSEAEYAKLMAAGETAMTAADYKKAVESFTGALSMKAADPKATARLSDAKMKLDELEGDKKKNEQYAALIKEADNLLGKKDYANAKSKYEAASGVKEEETYPKQKMKECQAFIDDLARKAEEEKKAKELEDKYNAAIAAADASFKAAKYEDAKGKYNEALGVKPAEKYPKDQLAAIDKAIADAAKKAEDEKNAKELEEKYKSAIAAADAAFKGEKYDDAKAKYNEALGVKPAEKYPKDQLAAIDTKLAELAKKAEEEKSAKALDEKYKAAITAGDSNFKDGLFDAAKGKYNEALEVKPAEKYPKDQLAAIEKKLAELAQKAEDDKKAKELDEQYKTAIAAADAAFGTQGWDEAKKKYNDAIGIKPAEKYPKDQLAAIDKAIADAAKKAEDDKKAQAQRELDEKYQAAITAADAAFGTQGWDEAKKKYNEAIGIKASEKYPKDQLAAIDRAITDAAKKAEDERKAKELDAKFQGLMDEAEDLFTKEQYQGSKSKFQEALGVKPDANRPKERIVEIDAKLAELAKQAEAERKRKELDDKYNALIASADKSYDGKKLSEALNDYKDALGLKPDEQHPKDRIAAIGQQLDADAQAKAEAERLAREKADIEQRYNAAIAKGDKAFNAKQYEDARSGYTEALEVKTGETYPTDRLSEIARILADATTKAEADRLKAEQEAAERDRLAAEQRSKAESEAQRDARYREAIAKGDIAFDQKNYDAARSNYTDALGVKPDEKYPKDRLAAIDQALAADQKAREDADRAEAERKRLEEERRQKEAADAEAARLASLSQQEQLDAQKALDEQYRKVVADADSHLGDKDYSGARDLYTQALDLRPKEVYPQSKIEQIDRMLEEEERRRREAELAAQKAPVEEPPARSGTTIDIRKEQQAEQFMREAREREEAEKYERIKKLKADVAQEQVDDNTAATQRQESVVRDNKVYEGSSQQLYQGSEAMRKRNAEELDAFRTALEERQRIMAGQAQQNRDKAYSDKEATQEQTVALDGQWRDRHAQQVQAEREHQEQFNELMLNSAKSGAERSEQSRQESIAANERIVATRVQGDASVKREQERVDLEKQAQADRQQQLVDRSQDSRNAAKEKLDATPLNQPRSFTDYNRSKLASEYPQGVTEESQTQGNKVIIRRVVVQGNKADEYTKVIAKWSTFYFKNGQPISEQLWSRDTEE